MAQSGAWDKGYVAFTEGETLSQNPYLTHSLPEEYSDEIVEWENGWFAAKQDEENRLKLSGEQLYSLHRSQKRVL